MNKFLVYGTDICKQIWQILVVNAASEHCTAYFIPKILKVFTLLDAKIYVRYL